METQEETAAEMSVEKTEQEIDDADDDISNGQDAPLKDDAIEPEIVGNKELVPFLCWEITQKRRKIFLLCAVFWNLCTGKITSPINQPLIWLFKKKLSSQI